MATIAAWALGACLRLALGCQDRGLTTVTRLAPLLVEVGLTLRQSVQLTLERAAAVAGSLCDPSRADLGGRRAPSGPPLSRDEVSESDGK